MRLALLAVLLVVATGCEKKNQDPNGVGPWQFGRSVLSDAEAAGRCLPLESGEMHCIGMTASQIGGQVGETDTYFRSKDKTSGLIEIAITVRSCDAAAVASDLIGRIGKPTTQSDDG
jgi:hypothetical protein